MLLIGIDTGTNTGFAVWDADEQRLIEYGCEGIIKVMAYLADLKTRHEIFVRIEDARLNKRPSDKTSRDRLRGFGSVSRDAAIWVEWCKFYNVPHVCSKAGVTFKGKDKAEQFQKITGIQKTNNHERDAIFMVWNTTQAHLKKLIQIYEHEKATATTKTTSNHVPKFPKKVLG